MNTVASCVLFVAVVILAALGLRYTFGAPKRRRNTPPCFCHFQTPQEMAENGCRDCEYRAACDPDGAVGDYMLGVQDAEEDAEQIGLSAAWRRYARQAEQGNGSAAYRKGYRHGLANHVRTTNQKLTEGERS